jgi:transposase
MPLARRARAGALTVGSVPTGAEEAMRALTRAREDALGDLQAAQFRLTAFVLRHALRSPGWANGGPAHLRWLSAGGCPTPAQPIVLHAEGRAVTAHTARLGRREQDRQEQGQAWRLEPVVEALQARRGVHWGGAHGGGTRRPHAF